jgi:hypothetical protein
LQSPHSGWDAESASYTFEEEGEFKPRISIFNVNFIPVEVGVTEFEMATSAVTESIDCLSSYCFPFYCFCFFVKRFYLFFPLFLNIKMSAIAIAERPIVTNPAGINDETKESALNLPNG